MTAELICVGTEILLGNIVNTNATFLAEKCAECGLSLFNQQVVGDNEERLKEAFLAALERADIIILSGGLGPTNDDITKEVISSTLNLKLKEDAGALKAMEDYFNKIGAKKINSSNYKQALIPEDGHALINKNGTAPAIMIETSETEAKDVYPEKTIFMLPGPPGELIPITNEYIVPYLKKKTGKIIKSKMIKLTGLGESKAASIIEDILINSKNPTVAPYAKVNEVHFRITASAQDALEADRLIEPFERKLNEAFSDYIFSVNDESLEDVIIRLASEKELYLVTAESCTGGLLASRLINSSGASNCFKEGYITYSDESKINILGVDKKIIAESGAVSGECAKAMALGALKRTDADVSVSITGIAGPSGGSEEKPVGLTYICVANNDKCDVLKFTFPGDRQRVRQIASAKALEMVWRLLSGK